MRQTLWFINLLAGALIGFISWGIHPATMPVSILIFPLWYYSPNRCIAGASIFCYFLAAGHGLPLASMKYFQTDFLPAFFDLALAVLIPSIPFFLLFFKNKILRVVGLMFGTIIIMVPPFGLTCLTHPLASTGVWFPGSGWLGLGLAIMVIPFFCRWPVLISIPLILGFLNHQSPVPSPSTWAVKNTYFSGKPTKKNNLSETQFNLADLGQQAKTVTLVNKISNDTRFLLLPESSGGNWNAGIDVLWQSMLTWPGTVLINATVPTGKFKDSVIMALSKNKKPKIIYQQRQTVPVSMWYPGQPHSYLAHWFDNPVVQVGSKKVSFFICYEQFLVWPVLQSIWHNPDLLATTSNIWWSVDTNIPAIQHNIMLAWSRLFSVPLITATNY